MDGTNMRTRRAVLSAATAGVAAVAATTLARPAQVLAGSDGDVVLGAANSTDTQTSIQSGFAGDAFSVQTSYSGATPNTAILGVADSVAGGAGVHGHGTVCAGVWGTTENGGPGVYGWSDTGVGVLAAAPLTRYGLWVDGRSHFKLSGRTSMTAGKRSFTKSLAGVTSSSIVIAVLQTNEAGVSVRAAVPAAGKFTVYLNKALASGAVVGWIVLN
jgi:hypothetical protein